jgi:hypothetical protein
LIGLINQHRTGDRFASSYAFAKACVVLNRPLGVTAAGNRRRRRVAGTLAPERNCRTRDLVTRIIYYEVRSNRYRLITAAVTRIARRARADGGAFRANRPAPATGEIVEIGRAAAGHGWSNINQ